MATVDIVLNVLIVLKNNNPDNLFINSLHLQYCNIGGLSKKQMEGLHTFAVKSNLISASKLATLEAIIKKKPTRYKSEVITRKIDTSTDNNEFEIILHQILEKFPQHKTALGLMVKCKQINGLTASDKLEINRLGKILLNK